MRRDKALLPFRGSPLVLHVALWVPITLLGAWYMARESVSWLEARNEVKGLRDIGERREIPQA